MSAEEKTESRFDLVVKALTRVAKTLGDEVTAERIMFTAELLDADLTDDQIVDACQQVMKREVRFPAPIKFIDYGRGSVNASAEDALEKVFKAIKSCGDMGGESARQYLGPAIWRIIQSFGGWYSLCTREDFNAGVFRAQFLQSYNTRVSHWEASGELEEMLRLENPKHPMKPLLAFKGNDLNEAIKPRRDLKLIDDGYTGDDE